MAARRGSAMRTEIVSFPLRSLKQIATFCVWLAHSLEFRDGNPESRNSKIHISSVASVDLLSVTTVTILATSVTSLK